ncbi:Tripartite motif-containing protein 2 [Paragonimus heterotremus]|uniref:Tripartite motif-containing protein 2 n=1 Tax=Paragonimus heterotremus TaxID=100268 RepID=A0A8J4STH1_9TREM|nr:Tripartite motif-containing protein 2 [Paragonimus heterotremus]
MSMRCDAANNAYAEFGSSAEQLSESKSDTTSLSSQTERQITTEVQGTSEIIKQAQDIISCLGERCEELERLTDSIPTLRKEIRSQIDQSMQMIQMALTERHESLLCEMDSILNTRTELITKMHGDFETRLQRLSSHVDLLKRLVQLSPGGTSNHGSQKGDSSNPARNTAVLKHKQEIEKLTNYPVLVHPSEYDTMSFFPKELDQLLSLIRCVGVIGLTSIDARKTTLSNGLVDEVSPVRRCMLNDETRIDILPQDSLGRYVSNPTSKDFTVSLIPRHEYVNEVKIIDHTECDKFGNHPFHHSSHNHMYNYSSPLQVVYKISTPGAYDLNIKLYGEHIQGSPFFVYARPALKPELKVWRDTMKTLSELPQRIQLVLVSHRRCKSAPNRPTDPDPPGAYADLVKLDRGDFLYSVGTKGRGDCEFANPTGICVTRDNKFLVADSNNATVQVFNSEQKFQFRFGEYGIQPGQLMRPVDVAETINGNYLVSDYDLHCVTVYTPAGAYMSRFGQRYLAGPKGIIADSRGRILVVDQKACMVCIFKPTGKFINRFGARGPADNQFTNPVSLAVNSQDEIYVSDYTQHAIKVFDMNGLYLFRFGVHGMESGMFHSPTGLAFDKLDRLYISDWGNNRIQASQVRHIHLLFTHMDDFLRLLYDILADFFP